jgi:Fur family ferric uptake transcriptional regulator
MTCTMHRTEELRQRGFRMTPQRQTILQILHDAKSHLSPSDVYTRANQSIPGLTEATVYRTLDFLAHNGMINPAQTASGHLVYEISGHDHHHILCRSCGESVEIEHSLLHKLYRQLEEHSRYQLTTSHLTFFGLCPACQANLHQEQ